MPIRIEVKTSGPAFPDQGTAEEYLAAVVPVLHQVEKAVAEFATHRIDRKTELKDVKGQVCGSVEILRF